MPPAPTRALQAPPQQQQHHHQQQQGLAQRAVHHGLLIGLGLQAAGLPMRESGGAAGAAAGGGAVGHTSASSPQQQELSGSSCSRLGKRSRPEMGAGADAERLVLARHGSGGNAASDPTHTTNAPTPRSTDVSGGAAAVAGKTSSYGAAAGGSRQQQAAQQQVAAVFEYTSTHGQKAVPMCQVPGCLHDLQSEKHFYARRMVCPQHAGAHSVLISGVVSRFCQQCTRFHNLKEFSGDHRSCDVKLQQRSHAKRLARLAKRQALRDGGSGSGGRPASSDPDPDQDHDPDASADDGPLPSHAAGVAVGNPPSASAAHHAAAMQRQQQQQRAYVSSGGGAAQRPSAAALLMERNSGSALRQLTAIALAEAEEREREREHSGRQAGAGAVGRSGAAGAAPAPASGPAARTPLPSMAQAQGQASLLARPSSAPMVQLIDSMGSRASLDSNNHQQQQVGRERALPPFSDGPALCAPRDRASAQMGALQALRLQPSSAAASGLSAGGLPSGLDLVLLGGADGRHSAAAMVLNSLGGLSGLGGFNALSGLGGLSGLSSLLQGQAQLQVGGSSGNGAGAASGLRNLPRLDVPPPPAGAGADATAAGQTRLPVMVGGAGGLGVGRGGASALAVQPLQQQGGGGAGAATAGGNHLVMVQDLAMLQEMQQTAFEAGQRAALAQLLHGRLM